MRCVTPSSVARAALVALSVAAVAAVATKVTDEKKSSAPSYYYADTVWDSSVLVGNTEGPGSMIITNGALLVQTMAAAIGPNTVTAMDPASGSVQSQVPDGSQLTGIRSGLGYGHGTGLYFFLTSQPYPQTPRLSAFDVGWFEQWSVSNFASNINGQPKPFAFRNHVYVATTSLLVVNTISGAIVTNVQPSPNLYANAGITSAVLGDGTPLLIVSWSGQVSAYNISDPASPTTYWDFWKETPDQGSLSNNPQVTPDARTVFVQSQSANVTSGGFYIGALNVSTGTLEVASGFGVVHVPFGTMMFGVTDEVVLTTLPSAGTVTGYSRLTGAVLWTHHTATLMSQPHVSCTLEPTNGTVVCVLTYTNTAGMKVSVMSSFDAVTGDVVWSHTFSPDAGFINTYGGFAPIVVGTHEVIVHWQSQPNSSQPTSVDSIRRIRITATAPPTPPPTPTPAPANLIVVEEFGSPSCPAGSGTRRTFTNGGCARNSASSSTLRFCVGSELQVQTFASSASCSGIPTSASAFAVGTCYPLPVEGGSLEVSRCG